MIGRHQLEGGFRGKQWSAPASIASAIDGLDLDPSAFSHVGSLRLDEVRPRHVRDFVRELRKTSLAPRTILNVYGVVHAMFRDAVVEELLEATPCVLARGGLPAKVDKDPAWRASATFEVREVERLISDPTLPVERRVMYALKALAGLRHGEAASLRWRHYDPTIEPPGGLVIAVSYDSNAREEKGTKTGVTRRVLVHPTLAAILAEWKLSHWERIYGRAPTSEDLIVGTRTKRPLDRAVLDGYANRRGVGNAFKPRWGHHFSPAISRSFLCCNKPCIKLQHLAV